MFCPINKSLAYPRWGTPAWGGFYYSSAARPCMVGRTFPIMPGQPTGLRTCRVSTAFLAGMGWLACPMRAEVKQHVLPERRGLGRPAEVRRDTGGRGKTWPRAEFVSLRNQRGDSAHPRIPQTRPSRAPTLNPRSGALDYCLEPKSQEGRLQLPLALGLSVPTSRPSRLGRSGKQ